MKTVVRRFSLVEDIDPVVSEIDGVENKLSLGSVVLPG
jgi:hypothetical protein